MASKKKRARPAGRRNESAASTRIVSVRYTDEEYAQLSRWAKASKPRKSVSELIRDRSLDRQTRLTG